MLPGAGSTKMQPLCSGERVHAVAADRALAVCDAVLQAVVVGNRGDDRVRAQKKKKKEGFAPLKCDFKTAETAPTAAATTTRLDSWIKTKKYSKKYKK